MNRVGDIVALASPLFCVGVLIPFAYFLPHLNHDPREGQDEERQANSQRGFAEAVGINAGNGEVFKTGVRIRLVRVVNQHWPVLAARARREWGLTDFTRVVHLDPIDRKHVVVSWTPSRVKTHDTANGSRFMLRGHRIRMTLYAQVAASCSAEKTEEKANCHNACQ